MVHNAIQNIMDGTVTTYGNNATISLFCSLAGKLAGISISTGKTALICYSALPHEPLCTTPEQPGFLGSRIDIDYDNPLFHKSRRMLCN